MTKAYHDNVRLKKRRGERSLLFRSWKTGKDFTGRQTGSRVELMFGRETADFASTAEKKE